MGKDLYTSGFGWSQGEFSIQPHVNLPEGTFEEEHARRGFYGRVSHLYHQHPPTGWLRIEGPLKPRAYTVVQLQGDELTFQPEVFLKNQDLEMGMVQFSKEVPAFFRNGDGDEVHFIHEGSGILETDYGDLAYGEGDYIVIPRGTTYRWCPQLKNIHLIVESYSEVMLPEKGSTGRHAPFDPMVMRVPTLDLEKRRSQASGEYEVCVKRQKQWTKVFYPWHPLNAVGWKGDLCPWALNVKDIRPIVSARVHLPPSVHTTFIGQNFVICSFVPRPLESEPGAVKVPFYHRNIDFDEVIFYHAGQFFSREGIGKGSVTWHPQGIHHGPHPNAAKNAENKTHTEEVAVMVDTKNPLNATDITQKIEYEGYAMSWKADQQK